MAATMVDGYPREVWWNADGETVVESYTITGMAHGTPLGIADNDERYGEDRRVPDRGRDFVVLSHREFLRPDRAGAASRRRPSSEAGKSAVEPLARPIVKEAAKPVSWPRAASPRQAAPRTLRGRASEISDVITRALTAAGLMK